MAAPKTFFGVGKEEEDDDDEEEVEEEDRMCTMQYDRFISVCWKGYSSHSVEVQLRW